MSSGEEAYILPVEGQPRNGSYVTWRELELALDPVKKQGDRIEKSVNLLIGHWFENVGAERERSKTGANMRFWLSILAGLLGAALATGVTLWLMGAS